MSSPGTIRAAAVQMEPKLGNVEENLDRILAGLEQAAADGAKLVVFPECALSGYGFGSREEGLAHAVASDGREVVKVAELARRTQCGCIFGLLERGVTALQRLCPDRPRWSQANLSQGPPAVSGRRHVRRPR